MDAEPVLDAERVRHDLFLPPSPVGREAVVRDEIPPPISAATEAYPRQVVVSRDRRAAYRRLVLLRRLRRAMEKLGPFIGDPGELLLTSGRVFGFVAAAREVRSGWAAVAPEWPVRHGRLVVRVVADPLALPLFRGLVPTQRANLAADWALAVGELERAAAGLRESLRVTRPGKALASRAKAIRVWLRMNPEWVLAVAAVGVLAAAVARTVARAAT